MYSLFLFVSFCSIKTNKTMRRWIFVWEIIFGCALRAVPGDGAVPGVIVEMEPYVVRADRILPIPEDWLYVPVPALVLERGENATLAPGYYVLSNLSGQNTRLFINELQLRQLAGMLLWPEIVRSQPKNPVIVILDGNHGAGQRWDKPGRRDWVDDPISRASPMPITTPPGLQWFDPAQRLSTPMVDNDPFGPQITDGTRGGESEADSSGPLTKDHVEAAMRGGVVAAWVKAGVPTAGFARPSEERLAAALSQEQFNLAMLSFSQQPPAWFVSGMGWLVASAEVSRTRIAFARGVDAVQNIIAGFRLRLPPLLALLQKETLETDQLDEILLAAAFTHYGLYGDNGKHRQKFMGMVGRQSAGERMTEALFVEVFGFGTKKMLSKLGVYARTFAAYKHHELRGKIPPMPEIGVSRATQAEAARLQAEAFIALGRLDLALDKLRIAYWRGEREPEMLAVLALLEQRAGSEARARKIAQTLMKLPQPPLRARTVAANLRLQDALSARPEGAKLNMDETVELMDLLGAAITHGIPDEDACETFAKVILSSPAQPPPNVTAFLKKAAAQYANNGPIAEAGKLAGVSP
jgi:hypothetical protein